MFCLNRLPVLAQTLKDIHVFIRQEANPLRKHLLHHYELRTELEEALREINKEINAVIDRQKKNGKIYDIE